MELTLPRFTLLSDPLPLLDSFFLSIILYFGLELPYLPWELAVNLADCDPCDLESFIEFNLSRISMWEEEDFDLLI